MGVMPEILSRYSCRSFLTTPLSPDELASLVEAAHLAPSAKNRQAWRFVAVTRQDLRDRITEACYGQEHVAMAPCLIACCTTNLDYKMPNGQLSYPVDLGVAGAFLALQATHLGLGSCMITTFNEEQVKTILTMPYLMKIVMLVAIGKPDDAPPARQRLPLSRIYSENRW
jgi:nitroreductase